MIYVLFILGFFLLIYGADYLVSGSSALARRMGISRLVVGLTIVALGTSSPELVVNIISALQGKTDVGLGNVVGSNIFNILMVVGVVAMFYPLRVSVSTVWKEIPYSFLAVALIMIMSNDLIIDGISPNRISRIDGIILLLFFAGFMYYAFSMAKKGETKHKEGEKIETIKEEDPGDEKEKEPLLPVWKTALYIIGGLAGLVFGGKWVVEGAVHIAKLLRVSDFLISVTIIGAGTSLPELVTSLIAAKKKEDDISVGNIIGSNIFNIFFIMGTTSVITPVSVPAGINTDYIFLLIVTAFLFKFMFTGNKHTVDRWEGVIFFVTYIVYMYFIIKRG